MTTATETKTPSTPEAILDLLSAQASLYDRLESYAVHQRALIQSDDPQPLIGVLAERQKLVVELADIAGRLSGVRKRWESCLESFDPDQRKQADELLSKAREHLKRVLAHDDEDARLLSAKKQAAIQEASEVQTTARAMEAYSAPVSTGGRLDRLSEVS